MEAANLFQGIVPAPYITRYTRHYANLPRSRFDKEDAIIPDILVDDYPTDSKTPQPRDGHHTTTPAIIEIKGIRITDGNYKLNGMAVEQRAAKIPQEYVTKAKNCDKKLHQKHFRVLIILRAHLN